MKVTKKDLIQGLNITCEIPTTKEEITKHRLGMPANMAFKKCNASQREFMISGYGIKSQEEIFGNAFGLKEVLPDDFDFRMYEDSNCDEHFIFDNLFCKKGDDVISYAASTVKEMDLKNEKIYVIDTTNVSQSIETPLDFYYMIQKFKL